MESANDGIVRYEVAKGRFMDDVDDDKRGDLRGLLLRDSVTGMTSVEIILIAAG